MDGTMEHLKMLKGLFRKVFHTPDGRRVISELRRRTRGNPKSDIEYAKQAGIQIVLDMIMDLSDFFGDEI
jgi:hypothetical protein